MAVKYLFTFTANTETGFQGPLSIVIELDAEFFAVEENIEDVEEKIKQETSDVFRVWLLSWTRLDG